MAIQYVTQTMLVLLSEMMHQRVNGAVDFKAWVCIIFHIYVK